MRNEIFQSHYPQDNRLPKNLRLNAREYAHEFTYTPYMEDPDALRVVGRPGRGANGESSS